MTDPIDALFDFLSGVIGLDGYNGSGILSVDRSQSTIYVRAFDGRDVRVFVTPEGAAKVAAPVGLEMGGATPMEDSFRLFLVHLDESINAFGRNGFVTYEIGDDGLITGVA
ncbi:hypothetical protein [Leifsonia xyli]|uniref:hypothetical protein n=1 Tax=Leifsonia xyli TaxID=1575 RepID=UPI003D669B68